MYYDFKPVWRWYTFKIKGLNKEVKIHETSEGMARYRAMYNYNIDNIDNVRLVSAIEG